MGGVRRLSGDWIVERFGRKFSLPTRAVIRVAYSQQMPLVAYTREASSLPAKSPGRIESYSYRHDAGPESPKLKRRRLVRAGLHAVLKKAKDGIPERDNLGTVRTELRARLRVKCRGLA